MTRPITFIRTFFIFISLIFMMTYSVGSKQDPSLETYIWGSLLGLSVSAVLIGLDLLFRRFNLRTFNVVVIGLFFGYLMSMALLHIFNATLGIVGSHIAQNFIEITQLFIFLLGAYLGVLLTLRCSDEIYLSIPFVKFTPTMQKTKDLLLDYSALADPRLIDLAHSGLLDNRLVLPRAVLNEIHQLEDSQDDFIRTRTKRALEVVRKLETLPSLQLRYQDIDFPEIKESQQKILHLARLSNADVLSADINKVQMAQIEGIRVINIHALSHALKPLMQKGEYLRIRVHRHGKEDQQGVGYLEDGTMVVINGGGNFIGEVVRARVLSVKHTTSGRMIFCNAVEEEGSEEYYAEEEFV